MNENETTLVISRILNAPRDLIYELWTEPGHLVHWWGPKDFSVPFCNMDARVGGRYRACLRSPDGTDYWVQGRFEEVAKPSRLVFSWAWEDAEGEPGHQTMVTLEFVAMGEKTMMNFRQEYFASEDDRDSHAGGWTECLQRLQDYLGNAALMAEAELWD